MNKQGAIKKVKDRSEYPGDFPCAVIRTPYVLDIIKEIDEPRKVKVPPVVFKFLNDNEQLSKQEKLAYLIRSKDGDQFYLTEMLPCDGIITDSDGDELFSWVEKQSHESLLNIWKYGYEVEEVEEWIVRVKGMYFLNWGEDGTYPTFVIDDNPRAKLQAKPFIKSEAQSLAEALHGSIEKV